MTSAREDMTEPSAGAADAALAFVCVLAPVDRESRLASVRTVFERANRCAGEQDGVLLEFPEADEIARTLLDFVLAERRCCPHFTYELCFVPEQLGITLRMRASGAYLTPLKTLYRELVRGAGID